MCLETLPSDWTSGMALQNMKHVKMFFVLIRLYIHMYKDKKCTEETTTMYYKNNNRVANLSE